MRVELIFKRIPHHAGHSGYDQLAKHVRARMYHKGLGYRLAKQLPEKWVQKVKVFNSDWYQRESLAIDLAICAKLQLPLKRLYHYLYGEDSVRLSSRLRPRWNNKVIASFHQPKEVLDGMFGAKDFIRGLDAAITLCEDQEHYFHEFLPADKVFTVHHGVDTEFWSPSDSGGKPSEPYFINVGWWQRDIEMLSAVIRRVHERDKSVRFKIVTFENLFQHYEGLPNTELLSGISDEDLREAYRGARGILIPLKAVTANNAVLEAMACGTAVVATDNGGLPEYVDDASGFKIPRGDVDTMTERVLELAADGARAHAIGRAARQRSARFDWRVVGEHMSYVYGRILGSKCGDEYFHKDDPTSRNICLLSEEYPQETGWGGIATYNQNLARGLADAGHKVYVISGAVDQMSVKREGNIEIHRVRLYPKKRWAQKFHWKFLQPLLRKRTLEFLRRLEFGIAARKKFKWLQDRVPLHIVESPEYYGSAWFVQRKFKQYPYIVKLHTPAQVNCYINSTPVTLDVRLCNIFEKGSTKRADLVCAPSRKIIDICKKRWIPSLENVELLEYPINTDFYTPSPTTWQSGPKNFLFTGRFEKRKGVDVLVQAFDRVARVLPDIELHMAGHDTPTFQIGERSGVTFGEYMKTLDLAPSTLERIHFLGRKTLDELIPLYQQAYACIIPSVSFENFPNSCLEALACGNAVIVTDAGGMVEMAPDGVAGIHVKAGDVTTLADAIDKLARDPALTKRLGEGARRVIEERYATPKMIAKIMKSYEREIQRNRYR